MRRFIYGLVVAASIATAAPAFARTHAAGTTTASSAAMPSCSASDPVVWVNTKSGKYHAQGSKYFGKTKSGKYLCTSQARAQKFEAAGTRGSGSTKSRSASAATPPETSDASPAAENASAAPATAGSTMKHHHHRKHGSSASPEPDASPTP